MATELEVGDVAVDVVLKAIKNIHRSVYPPTGRVRISSLSRMNLDNGRPRHWPLMCAFAPPVSTSSLFGVGSR